MRRNMSTGNKLTKGGTEKCVKKKPGNFFSLHYIYVLCNILIYLLFVLRI